MGKTPLTAKSSECLAHFRTFIIPKICCFTPYDLFSYLDFLQGDMPNHEDLRLHFLVKIFIIWFNWLFCHAQLQILYALLFYLLFLWGNKGWGCGICHELRLPSIECSQQFVQVRQAVVFGWCYKERSVLAHLQ